MDEQPLTEEQQKIAADAAELIPAVVAFFMKKMPCLREMARNLDVESAGRLACVMAARTYDPSKGGLSAYFSVAIRNGILREIQRELRTGSYSIWRIPLDRVANSVEGQADTCWTPALDALMQLGEDERALIEKITFDGTSLRALSREHGVGFREAKRRVKCQLDRLRREYEDSPAVAQTGPRH